jgi:hypothetical protein
VCACPFEFAPFINQLTHLYVTSFPSLCGVTSLGPNSLFYILPRTPQSETSLIGSSTLAVSLAHLAYPYRPGRYIRPLPDDPYPHPHPFSLIMHAACNFLQGSQTLALGSAPRYHYNFLHLVCFPWGHAPKPPGSASRSYGWTSPRLDNVFCVSGKRKMTAQHD